MFHPCLDPVKREDQGAEGSSEFSDVRKGLGEGHTAVTLIRILYMNVLQSSQTSSLGSCDEGVTLLMKVQS